MFFNNLSTIKSEQEDWFVDAATIHLVDTQYILNENSQWLCNEAKLRTRVQTA